jgi:hypothetical protein
MMGATYKIAIPATFCILDCVGNPIDSGLVHLGYSTMPPVPGDRSGSPFEVALYFPEQPLTPARTWIFGRDLLDRGTQWGSSGCDIKIVSDGEHVDISMLGVQGESTIRLNSLIVVEFLAASYQLCAADDEERVWESTFAPLMDAELEALLMVACNRLPGLGGEG